MITLSVYGSKCVRKKNIKDSYLAKEKHKFPGNNAPWQPQVTRCNSTQQLSMPAD